MVKVTLVSQTALPVQVAAAAYKICYSAQDIDGIFDSLDEESAADFLEKVSSYGHESPIEHASFTFSIEGVSRSLMAQFTRHRIASFSVRSQRYVKENDFTFVIPPEIAENDEALEVFNQAMDSASQAYRKIADILGNSHKNRFISQGLDAKIAAQKARPLANEDARFVLPNACETQMLVTMNARALRHFFELRCCNRAQWEIRALAWQMLDLCKEAAPALFKSSGPRCVSGACPEGQMTCGKAQEVRAKCL